MRGRPGRRRRRAVLLACHQWDPRGLARRLPSRGAGAWRGEPLLPWRVQCPGPVCAALAAASGGWGRCRVSRVSCFPRPAPRSPRCVWRVLPSGYPLSSIIGTPFHAVCAFFRLGLVALLVFPACPLCVCVCSRSRGVRPPHLPWLVWRAHPAWSRCWAPVGPFHDVCAPPRVLHSSCAVSGLLWGGWGGPVSPLPGLGPCAPRGVGLRVWGVPAPGGGLGWVGSRPHPDLRDHGRRPSLRVTTGPVDARLSGRKACRTDDRPRAPRWHTREGVAAVPVCMGRAGCLCMWGGSRWCCEARRGLGWGGAGGLRATLPDGVAGWASGVGGCLASVRPSAFSGQATKRVSLALLCPWRTRPPYRSGSCSLAVPGRGPLAPLCAGAGLLVEHGSCWGRRPRAWRRALLLPPSRTPRSCRGGGGLLCLRRGGGPASPWPAGRWGAGGGAGGGGGSRRGSLPPSSG